MGEEYPLPYLLNKGVVLMKIYNYEINRLYDFLLQEELVGKKSRMRTRFCKMLLERMQQISDEHQKLILEFAELDENGNPKTEPTSDGKQRKYVMRDFDAFSREYDILMREEFVIEETEERKDMLLTVADIVLNSNQTFSGQDAIFYDRFCEVFENLSY
jgi:hypothetical protein